jgi:hypothetical protein
LDAIFDAAIAGRELDPVTLRELCQLHCALGLGQKVQSLDHHPVEVQQVFLPHVAKGLCEQIAVQNRLLGIHRRHKSRAPESGGSPQVYGSANPELAC